MQASISLWSKTQFRIFIMLQIIIGASQGLVAPLIATKLEQMHIPPSINGISAAMLYLGVFVSMFFCDKLLKYIGYQKTILTGILVMFLTLMLFPLTTGIWWWSLLRFLLGVGDNIITFAIQLWIATHVTREENGKRFSQFGLAYGLGLGLGPLGLNLEDIGFYVPFVVMLIFLIAVGFICLTKLQSDIPVSTNEQQTELVQQPTYRSVFVIGFLPMLAALIYGFIEVGIAGNFPVYGMKTGLSKTEISLLISAFLWGSLVFQIPLGILGDKIGRHRLLFFLCLIGGIGMITVPSLNHNLLGLLVLLIAMGSLIGSMLSLSLAFINDVLPPNMLARGNLMTTSHFAVGSMIGPFIGGMLMEYTTLSSLFYFLAVSLFSFALFSIILYRRKEKTAIHDINLQ